MDAIRKEYEKMGVDNFYKQNSNEYKNPHYNIIKTIIPEIKEFIGPHCLDLCCGGGEITMCLPEYDIKGLDPYTYELYKKNTNKECYKYSFVDIVQGKLTEKFDTIIRCFALHLCKESMLPTLLWQLSTISKKLIVISPHKRPDCNNVSGWTLEKTIKKERVTAKIYSHI